MIERPSIPANLHPVETDKTLVPTPQIALFLETLNKWTKRRKTGGMLYGVPRVGKDRAINYIIKAKQAEPDDFLYEHATMRGLSSYGEKPFWTHLLEKSMYAIDDKDTSSQMWRQLSTHLASKVINADKKGLVLFVNEAQKLNEFQFDMLHDLHNALGDDQGIYACFIIAGQPSLVEKRNGFIHEKTELVGRLMTLDFEMRGVQNEAELSVVLQGYDKPPVDQLNTGGWPYSKYFFPENFNAEWRLEHEAKNLWRAFELVHEEERIPKKLEPRLQDVIHTINGAFMDYSIEDGAFFDFNLAIWKQAIRDSGYASSRNYIQAS